MTGKVIPLRRPDIAERDDELIRRCAAGDMTALAELFDRHFDVVRRLVIRIIGDASEADDLAQNTFLQVSQSAASFVGKSQGRTWILGVAANLCRVHQRSRGRRARLTAHFLANQTIENAASRPAGESRVMLSAVWTTLQSLPTQDRETFVLCELEGVSCKEAAQILNVPSGTIYRRLHDARKSLRADLLGEENA